MHLVQDSSSTFAWAVTQHSDTSKNTKATLKCYLLHALEFRGCVKVKVAVLGSLSLTVCTVSVDVNQH